MSSAFDLDTEAIHGKPIQHQSQRGRTKSVLRGPSGSEPVAAVDPESVQGTQKQGYALYLALERPASSGHARSGIGGYEGGGAASVGSNPGTQWGAANTLFANIQVVLPGEVVRSHRHTNGALRFIIEGKIGYTVVDGQRYPMVPGDLVITPSWSWHDHANESDVPMLWLDSLDAPLVRLLEVGFREDYPDEIQPPGEGNDNSQARYSSGGLRPAWEPAPSTPHTPMCRYPLEQAKAALDRLAAAEAGSPYDGIILEYTNPITGGPVMPTIGCYIQLLRPGEHTECHRHTSCVCYHVVEGSGYTVIDGQRLD